MLETTMDVTSGNDGGQQKRIEVSNVVAGAFADYRARDLNVTGATIAEAPLEALNR